MDSYFYVKEAVKAILKSDQLKTLVISFLGSSFAKAVGFKAWLLGMVIDYGMDKAIIPLVNEMIISGYYATDYVSGKRTLKKIREAVDENDRNKWLAAMSDL